MKPDQLPGTDPPPLPQFQGANDPKPKDEEWKRPDRTKSDWFRTKSRSIWFKVRDFWWPLVVTIAFVIACWWVWGRAGGRPIGFSILVILIGGTLIWFSVKIYYLRVMKFDWFPDTEEMVIVQYDIPIDQGPRIKIDGPSGFVKDKSGNEIRIVSTFDPDSLEGLGSWPNGWTKAHFVGYLNFCWKLIGITKQVITDYGMGNERAQADWLKYRAFLGAYRDYLIYPEEDGDSRKKQTQDVGRAWTQINEEVARADRRYRN